MTPSYFQSGAPIRAEQLNSLVDWVKRNSITAGVGYTLNQSPGGTSISISPPNAGGGAASTAKECTWNVSDASERNQSGSLDLIIRVGCWEIENTGRWPVGSSAEHPYYDIQLGTEQGAGWIGVYVDIRLDQQNKILPDANAVMIGKSESWVQSNSTIQRTYLAGVTISLDSSNKPYISYIDQYCPAVTIKPAPVCPFLIEDWGMGETENVEISIRSTQIERHYPTGMDAENTYRLTIPDTQQWFAVYAVLVTDQNGNIQYGENDVTLALETEYKDSTSLLTYFLLGEVNTGYDADGKRVIDYIYNACLVPFITGAINPSDGKIIPRGTSSGCPAMVSDASTESTLKVQIATFLVDNRYPQGMGLGLPPLERNVTGSGYVFCKLKYKSNDVVLETTEDAIQVIFSEILEQNTTQYEYIILASIVVANSKISSISNICQPVVPNACNLKWN